MHAALARRAGRGGCAGRDLSDVATPQAARDRRRRVRPDVIFHLASHVTGSAASRPSSLRWSQSRQHRQRPAARPRAGCSRVVLAGSLEEPGDEPSRSPVSPYAAAKSAATAYGRCSAASTALRRAPAGLHGLRARPGDETKLVPYVITSLLRERRRGCRAAPAGGLGLRRRRGRRVPRGGRVRQRGWGDARRRLRRAASVRDDRRADRPTDGTGVEPEFGALPTGPHERVRVADVGRDRRKLSGGRRRRRSRRGSARDDRVVLAQGDSEMRVLVTGHHGYIGSVLAPLLQRRSRRRRPRHVLLPRLRLRGRAQVEPPRTRRPRRRAVGSRGLRRDRPPRGALERSSRRSQPELTYEINRAERSRSLARRRRRVSAGSCSRRRARMYGAAEPDEALDEEAALRPLTPYAESKVRRGRAAGARRRRTSPRSRCGTRPSTASRLACGSTSCSTTSSPGPTRPGRSGSERRLVVAAARPRPGRRAATVRAARRPRGVVRGEAFNIGSTRRTTGSASWRRSSTTAPGVRRIDVCRGRVPDPRSYRVDFSKFASPFRSLAWSGRPSVGRKLAIGVRVGGASRSTNSRVTGTSG